MGHQTHQQGSYCNSFVKSGLTLLVLEGLVDLMDSTDLNATFAIWPLTLYHTITEQLGLEGTLKII